jgi:hypothetical protein
LLQHWGKETHDSNDRLPHVGRSTQPIQAYGEEAYKSTTTLTMAMDAVVNVIH